MKWKKIKCKKKNNSCKEFYDYIKALSKENKLSIIEKENKMVINFIVEYLLKKDYVEIILFQEKQNIESIVNNLYKEISLIKETMNKENQNLKQQNTLLKKDIENLQKENSILKEEIKNIKNLIIKVNQNNESSSIEKSIYNSDIMKEGEFDIIKSAITSRMKKEIKGLKKLYQATIDGESAVNFHKKCDNIPNTLIIIKSNGNRRFGGFASEVWESYNGGKFKADKNAFLFSLDKQKIYPIKRNEEAIYVRDIFGPYFGFGATLFVSSEPIKTKNSFTYETCKLASYEFFGESDALSEGRPDYKMNLKEYEVFQVIV